MPIQVGPDRPAWLLDDALEMVRRLQPKLIPIYWNVVVGGSVLYKGESSKDLDLVFFPYDTSKAKVERLTDYLEYLGWRRTHTHEQLWKHWRAKGATDRKHVEIWRTFGGKRVDCIVL